MKQELHLFITGLVQGVSYRANAAGMAERLGIAGWVRNLPDGRVELLAQGEDKALKSLLAWVHEGPSQARVDHVEAHWAEPLELLPDFRIRS
jgi:acylphosphatase